MKRMPLVIAAAVVFCLLILSAALGLYAQSKREKKEERVILGAEWLKAEEAEKRRKASGEAGVSPMPAGKYEFSVEELGLVNPKPNALDAALTALCRRYAQSDPATRQHMRRSIDGDELYTLWNFAERAAVFALRERSAARLADGLNALALIERERVDFRDLYTSVGMLHYSAEQIGANHQKLFRDAAALAEPGTAEIIRSSLTTRAGDRPAGHVVIVTEGGVGFMGWFYPEKYEPTYDLKRAAVDVARLVAADGKYEPMPWVGPDFTGNGLKADDDAALKRALGSVRASASVNAWLMPDNRSAAEFRLLNVYLVETADEPSARALLDIARGKKSSDYHTLALREGRLFCLLVADAVTDGAREYETAESLRRFEGGLADILRRHAAKRKS
jgi:hypothetical protein